MPQQEPVPEEPVELVDQDVDVPVGGQFPALPPPFEHRAHRGPAGLREHPQQLGQMRVPGRLADEGAQGRRGRPALGGLEGGDGQSAQVLAEAAGVRRGHVLGGAVGERVQQDGTLGGPPAIEGLFSDPGRARDRLHADGGAVGVGEQFQRGVEDREACGLVTAPSGVRAGFLAVVHGPILSETA